MTEVTDTTSYPNKEHSFSQFDEDISEVIEGLIFYLPDKSSITPEQMMSDARKAIKTAIKDYIIGEDEGGAYLLTNHGAIESRLRASQRERLGVEQ